MPDNLIPRLRARQDSLSNEAADEIQALREESGGWEVASEMWQEQAQQSAAEIERLRKTYIPLPNVKLEDQWGNPYPAYTKVPKFPDVSRKEPPA